MRSVLLLTAAMAAVSLNGQTAAPKPPASPSALDKSTLEQYVRHMFVWPSPQVQVQVGEAKPSAVLPGFHEVTVTATAGQASQAVTFHVSGDGRKIIQGNVFDVTQSPFQADLNKIKTDLQPSFGTPGAPVVVVVYSDFQCSFCKEEAKVLRETLTKEYPTQVRVYFKDYPLEPIHPWAKPAAIAGRCIFRQKPAAFWDYHDWIFSVQNEITTENLKEKVEEFGKTKGLEPIQLGSCMETKATEAEVNRSMAEARTLGVNSTPTLFVNGRRVVGNVPWQQLKTIIDHEIEWAKTHGGGEKCCEVTLPTGPKQ
jgi:protein-disulfide isomerase